MRNLENKTSPVEFGISKLSIIPVRKSSAETSEMVTQILFGEYFEVLEEEEKWCRVRLAFDGYEGWVDKKMITPLSIDAADKLMSEQPAVTTASFNIVQPKHSYHNFLIVAGSSLPFFNSDDNTFNIGDATYSLHGNNIAERRSDIRSALIEYGMNYFNAPYLWGGRSPFGIDCSGLVQNLYKMCGITIPRDASEQVKMGEPFLFVEEALPGDLAFFDNEEGAITHVGLIWEKGRIIHASGQVRIDKVDHNGIFNVDTRQYSHKLRVIKRIIQD